MTTDLHESLKQMPLFAEFTFGEIDALLDLVEIRNVEAGDALVRQDEHGDCMFIIVKGAVSVVHRAGGQEFPLAKLGVGEFFGEIALVDEGPRSADVIAAEPCVVLTMEQSVIRALAGVYPTAAFKLLIGVGRKLVQRLRQGNKKYIDSLLLPATGEK